MNCFFVTHHFTAFHRGELNDETQADIRAHLESCAACRRTFEGTLQAMELLRGFESAPVLSTEAASSRVIERLTAYLRQRPWWERPLRKQVLVPILAGWIAIFGLALWFALPHSGSGDSARDDGRKESMPEDALGISAPASQTERTIPTPTETPIPATPTPVPSVAAPAIVTAQTPTPSPTSTPVPSLASPGKATATPPTPTASPAEEPLSLEPLSVRKTLRVRGLAESQDLTEAKVLETCKAWGAKVEGPNEASPLLFVGGEGQPRTVSMLFPGKNYLSLLTVLRRIGEVGGQKVEPTRVKDQPWVRFELTLEAAEAETTVPPATP